MAGADRRGISRRRFLASSAAAVAWGVWRPAFEIDAARAGGGPAGFPLSVPLYKQAFENWAQDIAIDDLWTCAPRTASEVAEVASWAYRHRYTLRPRGAMHNWSPLAVAAATRPSARIVMVDTTKSLKRMRIETGSAAAVRVETGATMEEMLTFVERFGYGLTAVPAPGDITVGGALAIGAHGTAIPADGEQPLPGHTYGTVSNLVVALEAIVWDVRSSRYVVRRFERADPRCAALLVHLGRAFITAVTLRVGPNQNLRCVSSVDIPASELFGARGPRTFDGFLHDSGRAEAIWFPFTSDPWLKVWTISPFQPAGSRRVDQPYNYPFTDELSPESAAAIRAGVLANPASTPGLGQAEQAEVAAGLDTYDCADIWGPSKNLLFYIRPNTLRVTANGYAVLTTRHQVQRVIAEFTTVYQQLVDDYRALGRYPMNMPVEIRVTGLDRPGDCLVNGAQPTALSALAPRPGMPWDVAVWLDILTFPTTAYADDYYGEIERWMLRNYKPPYATVHPEWSKGWAYTARRGAWTNRSFLHRLIPHEFTVRRPRAITWRTTVNQLQAFDPHEVFTSPLLRTLMRPRIVRGVARD
jgi:FAD/FMN-containing dehydrogenase